MNHLAGSLRCLIVILAAAFAGCASPSGASSETGSDDGSSDPCVPGQTMGCLCDDGSPGARTCDNGGGFGECACQAGAESSGSDTASGSPGGESSSAADGSSSSSAASDATGDGSETGSPTEAVFDDFERAELGPSWRIWFPQPPDDVQVAIVDNSDLGLLPGPQGFFVVTWMATTFAADQFSEATIPEDVTDGWIHQVVVRWRGADGARYGFGYGSDPGQVDQYQTWYFKYDGVPGPETRWIATTPAAQEPAPGDTLRLEVEGFTLRGYFNDALVLEATDTDPSKIADGEPGMAARWATGNQGTEQPAKVWESWSGGDL